MTTSQLALKIRLKEESPEGKDEMSESLKERVRLSRPDLWERFVRACERERRVGQLERERKVERLEREEGERMRRCDEG